MPCHSQSTKGAVEARRGEEEEAAAVGEEDCSWGAQRCRPKPETQTPKL